MAVSGEQKQGEHVGRAEQGPLPDKQVWLENFKKLVWQAHFNLAHDLLLFSGLRGGANLHRVATGHRRAAWGGAVQIGGVALDPAGTLGLLGDAYGDIIHVWDFAQDKIVRKLKGHTKGIRATAFSPDGRRALSGALDQTVRLWDVATGTCLHVLQGHTGSVLAVAFAAEGQHAFSGGTDNTIRYWDLASGECQGIFTGHTTAIRSLACSASHLLSGSSDTTVRLWDIANYTCAQVLEGHRAIVGCVALHPNGCHAASGANDETIRLWDLASGTCVASLASDGLVAGLAISQDGNTLFAASLHEQLICIDLSRPQRMFF